MTGAAQNGYSPRSRQFIGFEFPPRAVADVEHIDLLLSLQNPEDYPVVTR